MPVSLLCFGTVRLYSTTILFAYDNLTIDAHRKALNEDIIIIRRPSPGKYGLRKEKATDIDALNIRLFYDPTRLKRVPETITFTDLVSNYNLFDNYNIIHIAPSPITQAKYTIKLSQSGLDLFSGAAQKTDGNVCVYKTKWYLLEFKWDATRKWSLADNKAGLFLNPPDGLQTN